MQLLLPAAQFLLLLRTPVTTSRTSLASEFIAARVFSFEQKQKKCFWTSLAAGHETARTVGTCANVTISPKEECALAQLLCRAR